MLQAHKNEILLHKWSYGTAHLHTLERTVMVTPRALENFAEKDIFNERKAWQIAGQENSLRSCRHGQGR